MGSKIGGHWHQSEHRIKTHLFHLQTQIIKGNYIYISTTLIKIDFFIQKYVKYYY